MKNIIIILSQLIVGCTFSKEINKDKICWEDGNLLEWRNFQGIPSKLGIIQALTTLSINTTVINGNKILVENCMIKKKSWVRKDNKTNSLLLHEQYHFNLAEVYVRKMRRELSSIIEPRNSMINSIVDKWIELYDIEDNKYDIETKYSSNKEKQLEWIQKIDRELKELEDYKDPVVILNQN